MTPYDRRRAELVEQCMESIRNIADLHYSAPDFAESRLVRNHIGLLADQLADLEAEQSTAVVEAARAYLSAQDARMVACFGYAEDAKDEAKLWETVCAAVSREARTREQLATALRGCKEPNLTRPK